MNIPDKHIARQVHGLLPITGIRATTTLGKLDTATCGLPELLIATSQL